MQEFCALDDDASIQLKVSIEGVHHVTVISNDALAAVASLNIGLCTRHDFYIEYFNNKHKLWMPYTTNIFAPDFPGYFYACGAYILAPDVVQGLSEGGVPSLMGATDEKMSCHASVRGVRLACGKMNTNNEVVEWMVSLGRLLEESPNKTDDPQLDTILILIETNCEAGGFYLPPSLTSAIVGKGMGLCLATVLETLDEDVQLPEDNASQ